MSPSTTAVLVALQAIAANLNVNLDDRREPMSETFKVWPDPVDVEITYKEERLAEWHERSLWDAGHKIREWLDKLSPDEADQWLEEKRESFADCYRESDW